MQISQLLATTLLAGAALAQGAIVSPLGTDVVEGNSNNIFPFGATTVRRYQQVHSDLGSTPLMITQLSFRMNASTVNYAGTRTMDMELHMGDGVPAMQHSFVFDNNYIGAKVLVLPRQNIVFGPQGQSVTPGPNAFTNMDLILPAPFVYTGANSLVWEVTHYGATVAGTMSALDADGTSTTTSPSSITGIGCIATGLTAEMTHLFICVDIGGTLVLIPTITNAPASSLAILGIGFTNPNLAFPGLCGNVYTDAVIAPFLGFTSATGTFTADNSAAAIVLPNGLTGVALRTQAFVVDPLSAQPIPFCVSNGRSVTVPASNLTHVNQIARIWNNLGGTTATAGIASNSGHGYGLVTRFSHL